MKTTILLISAVAALAVPVCGQAATSRSVDYSKLNEGNMPPVQIVAKEVMKASTSGYLDMKSDIRRIHLRNLLPRFRAHYGENSTPHYQYGIKDGSRTYDYYSTTGTLEFYDTPSEETFGPTGTTSEAYGLGYLQGRWYLNKLLVDREEIYLREVGERITYYQNNTMKNAVEAYTRLFKLLVERSDLGSDPSIEFDISVAAAQVDFYAGGFLARHVAQLKDASSVETTSSVRARPAVPASAKVKREEDQEKNGNNEEMDPIDPSSPLFQLAE